MHRLPRSAWPRRPIAQACRRSIPSFRSSELAAWRLFGALVCCQGCQDAGPRPSTAPGRTLAALTVTSPAFPANGPLPIDDTCDGADRSPPLTWSAAPSGTRSLVVTVDDPDAPGGGFTHWVLYDIPADVSSLPEGAGAEGAGPGVSGTNDFHRIGYSGPCPPKLEMHRYVFRVYALDALLGESPGATRGAIEAAMHRHVLAEGHLVGTYAH